MQDVTLRLQHLEPDHVIRFLGHPTHSHDVPHLVYVAAGAAHVRVDGVRMTLRTHESVWLAPGVPHAAQYERGSLVLGPFLDSDDLPPSRALKLGVTPELTALMTTILGVAPHAPEQIAQLRRALGQTLRRVTGSHFTLVIPRHPGVAHLARTAVISARTLEELAPQHGLSARQVQRVFVNETGMPFHRWRTLARLNIAIARLRGGEKVAVAARHARYATRSGLIKALRREVAPSDLDEILSRPTSRDSAIERAVLPKSDETQP